MNRSIRYSCLFCLFCLGLVGGPRAAPTETADSAQAKAKLAEVRGRIAALTNRLSDELKDRDALAGRLREADLSITAKRRRLDDLRSTQAAAQRRSIELHMEQMHDQSALESQRTALGRQVRAAYMIGQQEQMKLLLNQSDPASAGRMLAFYGYFVRQRGTKIDEIRGHLERLQELVAEETQVSATLAHLQVDTTQEMKELQHAHDERQAALAAVTTQVQSGTQELEQLKREEQAEEALLADLARVLQDFPVETQQSFEELRGKLPWPVTGRMSASGPFGPRQEPHAPLNQSGMRWNGVLIDTAHGAKVRAPYFGRVVYADWLQGLGLLLIIGHSGNYMTLYGHAEVLYKSVGDWVAPGDVIAALSESKGTAPQLYFEIRDGRKAVDPRVWLKASP